MEGRSEAMLKGFEHVNLTCSDLDKTMTFYRDLLGMREVVRKPAAAGGEVAFLAFPAGGMLEIFCPAGPVATPARELPLDEAGIRHLALAVENVDAAFAMLTAAGVTFTEKPRDAINKEIVKRLAFCLDPDGVSIELTER
jgi:glyoxylase I family protein